VIACRRNIEFHEAARLARDHCAADSPRYQIDNTISKLRKDWLFLPRRILERRQLSRVPRQDTRAYRVYYDVCKKSLSPVTQPRGTGAPLIPMTHAVTRIFLPPCAGHRAVFNVAATPIHDVTTSCGATKTDETLHRYCSLVTLSFPLSWDKLRGSSPNRHGSAASRPLRSSCPPAKCNSSTRSHVPPQTHPSRLDAQLGQRGPVPGQTRLRNTGN